MLLGSCGRVSWHVFFQVSESSDSIYSQIYANITHMCKDIAILNSHNQTDKKSFFKNKLKSNIYIDIFHETTHVVGLNQ